VRLFVDNSPKEIKSVLMELKGTFLYVGFFSLFINLLMLVPPLYMLQLYDRVVTSRSEDTLIMLTLIVVALFIVMGLLEFVRSRLLVRSGNRMDRLLNHRIFDAMFKMSLIKGGSSSQPLTDLTQIRQFLTGNGTFAFFDAPWIPVYLGLLFLFHPLFGWFAIGAIIFQVIIAFTNEFSTKKLLNAANTQTIASNNYASSNLRNSEVIHALGMGKRLRQLWYDKHAEGLQYQSAASDRASIWMNLSKTSRIMSQSLMLGVGGYLAITDQITPGMMIAGSIIMGRAMAPIDLMVGSWKGFSTARSAYHRLNGLLAQFPNEGNRMSLPAPEGQLSLDKVVAAPPGSREAVVKGVSFSLEAGDVLGIVGPSAAGKSSLARVILGIWPHAAGDVRIDGAAISHWNREELGPHLGYLPQDIELFSGTVAENIARFGEVESEKVIAAAKMAGVHELILELQQGYDTPIGQSGTVLSGGQRQRIGLARALYDEPKLVVLDEPNSNLDEKGEAALLQAVNKLQQNKATVLLITHRSSVLKSVNKMLVMREGALWMFGKRDEVIAELGKQKKAASNVTPLPSQTAK